MRSLTKILFILVLVALVGFTLVVNEDKITEPTVTEEVTSVEEVKTEDIVNPILKKLVAGE